MQHPMTEYDEAINLVSDIECRPTPFHQSTLCNNSSVCAGLPRFMLYLQASMLLTMMKNYVSENIQIINNFSASIYMLKTFKNHDASTWAPAEFFAWGCKL